MSLAVRPHIAAEPLTTRYCDSAGIIVPLGQRSALVAVVTEPF
jgi:hypothetical protein